MPASEVQDVRRGRLLQGFFWGGVGLAVLAMLALLFSQSVMVLRIAVILCVIAIMLLAISIVLRPSVDMVRVDIEEHIVGEVERVRLRARDDISTAARNTHRVLSEKIHVLTATVEALRGQIEELKVSTMLNAAGPATHMGQPSATGVVHRTETVQVTRRTTTVDPGDEAGRGTVYGSRSAVDGEWSEDRGEERGTRTRAAETDRAPSRPSEGYGEADWEATFRSLSRQPSALPASPGRPASWYADDRGDDEWARSWGREREPRHQRDRDPEYGRHSERHRDRDDERDSDRGRSRDHERDSDRGRSRDHERDADSYRDRYRDEDRHRHRPDRERGRDDDRRYEQERERERGREYDRDRDHERERDREYGREREYDRERHHRRERESDRDRDHDRRIGPPPEPSRDFDAYLDGYARDHDSPAYPRPRTPSEWER